jgi:hypothetical protein
MSLREPFRLSLTGSYLPDCELKSSLFTLDPPSLHERLKSSAAISLAGGGGIFSKPWGSLWEKRGGCCCCCCWSSVAIGADLSTGGSGAHGDFTGVGGPGGFATKVGFSAAPLSIKPLPELLDIPPNLSGAEVDVCGAGDLGFGESTLDISLTVVTIVAFAIDGTTSSACGNVIFVPSVHSIDSGAQSSSSSSISAQLACRLWSSD